MTRLTLTAMAAMLILAGCTSSGPVYRGEPPAGMSDRQYKCKLQGRDCSAMSDRSTVSRNEDTDGGTPF